MRQPRRTDTAKRIVALAFSTLMLAACATTDRTGSDQSGAAPESARILSENRQLQEQVSALERENSELRSGRMAECQLTLAEKEARIDQLESREAALQQQLDDAIKEVVRAKAKMRSLESRAEAASTIAETEIALKSLGVDRAAKNGDPDLIQAGDLLAMSTKEFKQENYGGALYLALQAKAMINSARIRTPRKVQGDRLPGESPFALALSLRTLKASNIRSGPGTDFNVIATVKANTPLSGYSRKGEWVRVSSSDGVNGWIFQSLVTGR